MHKYLTSRYFPLQYFLLDATRWHQNDGSTFHPFPFEATFSLSSVYDWTVKGKAVQWCAHSSITLLPSPTNVLLVSIYSWLAACVCFFFLSYSNPAIQGNARGNTRSNSGTHCIQKMHLTIAELHSFVSSDHCLEWIFTRCLLLFPVHIFVICRLLSALLYYTFKPGIKHFYRLWWLYTLHSS